MSSVTFPYRGSLGALVQIVSGQHVLAAAVNGTGDGEPYLTGPADFVLGVPSITKWVRRAPAFCESQDTLVTVKGSGVGTIFRATERFAISRQLMAVRFTQGRPAFLPYLLEFSLSANSGLARGTIPQLTTDDIASLQVCVPTLEGQDRIVDMMRAWDEGISIAQRARDAAVAQSRAVVGQMLRGDSGAGLRSVRLGQIAEVNPGIGNARPEPVVAFYGMADLSEAGVFRAAPEMRPLDAVRVGFTRFRRGDVLVAKITPCFENGKAGHLTDAPTDVCFGSTEFHVLRAREVPPEIIAAVVRHPAFRERGARSMTGSAGQQRVPAQFLRDFPLTLPNDDELRRMAALLRVASHRAGLLEAYAANLQIERRALMSQLLSGALSIPATSINMVTETESVYA